VANLDQVCNLGNLLPLRDRETVSRTALLFDHFVTRNSDLLPEVAAGLMGVAAGLMGKDVNLDAILIEVERRAQGPDATAE
jgi:hypothetical protein